MCKTLIYSAFLSQQHYFPKMESVLAMKDLIITFIILIMYKGLVV